MDLALFEDPELDWGGPWTARPVNADSAAKWLGDYHYLGTVNTSSVNWGVYCPDMIAVVSVGNPANEHGVAKKFGLTEFPGNSEITRVAVHPDSPKNTATRAVAKVCDTIHKLAGKEWVFSYADTGAGHHGGIYQGLNAVYLGLSEARPGYIMDGKPIHPRTVVSMFGTQAREEAPKLAKERGHDLVWVADLNTAKHTYVLPIGSRRSRYLIRQALADHTQPYPKRDDD